MSVVVGGKTRSVVVKDRRDSKTVALDTATLTALDKKTAATVTDNPSTVVTSNKGVQGPKGERGDPGDGTATLVSFESGESTAMTRGTAVCVISGKLYRANSSAAKHRVVGLLYDDVLDPGVVGRVQTDGNVEQPTLAWAGATGMPGGLAAGSTYFVTADSYIQPFAPVNTGEVLVPVGTALSPTTLRVELNPPILL